MKVASSTSKEGKEAAIRRFVATYSPFSYYATLPEEDRTALREALLADLAEGTASAPPLLQKARDAYVVTPIMRPPAAALQQMLAEGEMILVAAFPELRKLLTTQDQDAAPVPQ